MSKNIFIIVLLLWNTITFAQTEKDTTYLKIEPFYDIPEIIDGGFCYFSSSVDNCRKNKYIFVNDFAAYGSIKINGILELLELKSYNLEKKEYTYSGRNVVLEIRIMGFLEEQDETYSLVEINVKSKHGSFEGILIGKCEC